jgi:hypothetical protein
MASRWRTRPQRKRPHGYRCYQCDRHCRRQASRLRRRQPPRPPSSCRQFSRHTWRRRYVHRRARCPIGPGRSAFGSHSLCQCRGLAFVSTPADQKKSVKTIITRFLSDRKPWNEQNRVVEGYRSWRALLPVGRSFGPTGRRHVAFREGEASPPPAPPLAGQLRAHLSSLTLEACALFTLVHRRATNKTLCLNAPPQRLVSEALIVKIAKSSLKDFVNCGICASTTGWLRRIRTRSLCR